VERGGGDCSIKYRLLNHKLYFIDTTTNSKFYIHYYKYSETNDFSEYIEFNLNDNSEFGSYSTSFFFNSIPYITYTTAGKNYYVKALGNNNQDSIYWNTYTTASKFEKFVRIKYQNDIYEVLP
jgi:hypothetical protein